MTYDGSLPFAACSYRVEVGYVLNKLNKSHQCLTAPSQCLPAETHIQIVYPPCGHPQNLSHDVTTSTIWSHALRVSFSIYLRYSGIFHTGVC